MSQLIFQEETYAIRAAIFEVYRAMGNGFLEAVYHECLVLEFNRCNIPFNEQKELTLLYKNTPLSQTYRVDFVCFDKIIVELKAVTEIHPAHKAQLLNYLKATGMKLGLLVNFGSHPKVQIERMVL